MSEKTIFDRILTREAPARVVHEDQDVLAFHDVNPQAPVHVLVIPKRRAVDMSELEQKGPEEMGRFFQGVARVARLLELEGGYRVVVNNGAQARQSVAYLHAHILGGRRMGWPPG